MRTVKLVSAVVLLALLISVGTGPTVAQGTEWTTFTHPEFGFSFSYPAEWYLDNYEV